MHVAILGAGLLGTCLSLELARRGISVDLYDREEACITQAGLRNEGKVHLGFVYGADPTFHTAEKMLLGALSFYPLMRRWIGDAIDAVPVSSPFVYLIEKGSLLTESEVAEYFFRLEEKIDSAGPIDYPGGALHRVEKWNNRRMKETFGSDCVGAAYQTPERSVDPLHLSLLLRQKVARSELIAFHPGSEITQVSIGDGEVEIEMVSRGVMKRKSYDAAANALWDGRLLLDAQVGLIDETPWNYRLKHAIFFKTTKWVEVPSSTIIQGPYGDFVDFGGGYYYASWYPFCQQGFVKNEPVPPHWNRNLKKEEGEALAKKALAQLARYIPALEKIKMENIEELSVLGGVIYAHGKTDVNDPKSGLHRRDQPAIQSRGNYYSINPGKFTLCPYFADQTARQMESSLALSAPLASAGDRSVFP